MILMGKGDAGRAKITLDVPGTSAGRLSEPSVVKGQVGAVAAPGMSQNAEQQVQLTMGSRDSGQGQTLPGDPPARPRWWYKTRHGYSCCEPWRGISRDQQCSLSFKQLQGDRRGRPSPLAFSTTATASKDVDLVLCQLSSSTQPLKLLEGGYSPGPSIAGALNHYLPNLPIKYQVI